MKSLCVATLLSLALPSTPQEDRTVGDVFAPGDVAAWSFDSGGEKIGVCWSRYDGPVDLGDVRAHRFTSQVELDAPTPAGRLHQRYDCGLWTDDRGLPLRVEFQAQVSDVYAGVTVAFAGEGTRATLRQGASERELTVDVPEGAMALANNFVGHMELLLALHAPHEGSGSVQLFSINGLTALPLQVTVDGRFEEGGLQGTIYRDSLGEVLRVADDGRLFGFEVPAQGLVVSRVPEAPPAFTIEAPASAARASDLEREEVAIAYDDVTLAGEVTRPVGVEGPLPAVFFVSGSGAQDRDGFASGIDLGTHEILDRLTREGYLVLRVDDRGAGASSASTEATTFDDLVEDARRCVRFLRERDDVDQEHVFVIGHSEGGQTAPILAAEPGGPDAIVLMAAPGRDLWVLLHEQLVRQRRLAGDDEEALAAFDEAFDDFRTRVEDEGPIDPEEVEESLRAFLPGRAWLRSHAAQDPIANLERVTCPILILQGARDIQVSLELDAEALRAALEASGHADFELIAFPTLDHLFKETVGEESSGLDYLEDRPIDAAFLDALVGWMNARR
jgi:pimeloyl-ACP methyl ester carboxylesterase